MKIDIKNYGKTPMAFEVSGRYRELLGVRGMYLNPYKPHTQKGLMPLTPLSLKILKDVHPKVEVSRKVVQRYDWEMRNRESLARAFLNAELNNNPKLYDFQKQGVSFLTYPTHDYRVLLGDDPRLGKTVQSLVAMADINPFIIPIHIFTMKSLMHYWADMVQEWTNFEPLVISGSAANRHSMFIRVNNSRLKKHKPYAAITNWETLRVVNPKIIKPEYLIGDEVHVVRNRKAQVTQQFLKLKPYAAILASATMLERGPQDYFPLLKFLRPKEFTSYWRFVDWYCETRFNGFGLDIVGTKNEDLLQDHLAPFSLRRIASEVADVPPKTYKTIFVAPTTELMNLYKEIEKETFIQIKEETLIIPNALARMVRLRQVSSAPQVLGLDIESPKIEAVKDYIVGLPQDMQVVVYSSFRSTVNELLKAIPGAVSFIGGQEFPTSFLKGLHKVLIATPQVGGVGLDLSCADAIIYVDQPQSSTILRQSQERTTKIGIKKPRLIINIVCTPIDRAIAAALEDKQEAIKDVDIYQYILRYSTEHKLDLKIA